MEKNNDTNFNKLSFQSVLSCYDQEKDDRFDPVWY